jgi:hypothetical protein
MRGTEVPLLRPTRSVSLSTVTSSLARERRKVRVRVKASITRETGTVETANTEVSVTSVTTETARGLEVGAVTVSRAAAGTL